MLCIPTVSGGQPVSEVGQMKIAQKSTATNEANMDATRQEWSREKDWFWEVNVQSAVLGYMQADEGFVILSAGQPVSGEQGLEIVAERNMDDRPVHRLVSVRGWPSQL